MLMEGGKGDGMYKVGLIKTVETFFLMIFFCLNKRYLKIDQYLAQHFEEYAECLSSPGNRVEILANCETLILLFLI